VINDGSTTAAAELLVSPSSYLLIVLQQKKLAYGKNILLQQKECRNIFKK
jgi:hypothetical protein